MELQEVSRLIHFTIEHSCEGRASLVHGLTHERVALPEVDGGEWFLEADDDGVPFLFTDADDVDPIFVGPLLSLKVLRSETGRLHVFDAQREQLVSTLEKFQAPHELASVQVECGHPRTTTSVDVAIFRLCRVGGSFSWSLSQLFYQLRFGEARASTSVAGRWCATSWASWEKRSRMLNLEGALLKSSSYSNSEGKLSDAEVEQRVLPWPSMTTALLSAMLLVWGALPRHEGGLRCVLGRAACKAFWEGLLRCACCDGWRMVIFVDDSSTRVWPACRRGARRIELPVGADGVVELGALRQAVAGAGGDVGADWPALATGEPRQTLEAFTTSVCEAGHGRSQLFLQVVEQVAHRIEQVLNMTIQGQVQFAGLDVFVNDWSTEEPYRLGKMIALHLQGVAEHVEKHPLFLSCTTDKSRVHGQALQNTMFMTPDNKVVGDFCSELEIRNAMDGPIAMAQVAEERAGRQRAYLMRSRGEVVPNSSLRPKKMYRRSALQWLAALHNQVRAFVPQGLQHFRIEQDEAKRPPPEAWPRLCIAPDQGGDGICAYHFLSRRLPYCVDLAVDPSHGGNNDAWLVADALGLKGLLLLFLVAINVPHGPWSEDARYRQAESALGELLHKGQPMDSPLFESMLPQLMADPSAASLQSSEQPELAMWRQLREDSAWARKGSKLVKSRFLAFFRQARHECKYLSARSFGYLYVCLEMGWMANVKMPVLAAKKDDTKGGEPASGTTSSKRESAEERALRASAQNNMVLAALVFSSQENACRLRLMLELVQPLEQWHSLQNVELRSASRSYEWMYSQVSTDFMATLYATVKVLSSERSLAAVPLQMPSFVAPNSASFADEAIVHREDALAQLLGDGALYMVGFRLMRNAWMMKGWPSRLILATKGGQTAELIVQLFKCEWEDFLAFADNPRGLRAIDEIAARSPFHLWAVKQHVEMFKASGWKLTGAIVDHIKLCCHRLVASQVVEDGFNRQKNAGHQQNRRATVQRSMGVLYEHDVAGSVHHYEPINLSSNTLARDTMVSEDAYAARFDQLPKEFLELQSLSPKTAWYTSSANAYSRVYVDLAPISFSMRFGCKDKLGDLFLGHLFAAKHHILVRHNYEGVMSCWHFPVKQMDDSASLLWPAVEDTLPDGTKFYMPMDQRVVQGQLWWPLVELNRWEAMDFCWRSPLAQLQAYGMKAVTGNGGHAVRAFAASAPKPLLEVSARNGFWALKLPFLSRLASHVGVLLDKGADLAETVEALLQGILGASGSDMITILEKRLSCMSSASASLHVEHEVTNMDDAQQLLDSSDRAELGKKVQEEQVDNVEVQRFVKTLAKQREKLRAAAPKPGSTNQAKKKRKCVSSAPVMRKSVPEGPLTQPQAKSLCPKGSYVWRNALSGSWGARHPPLKEFSRSWLLYGHRESAMLCIQKLWEQHSELGFEDECFVDGLGTAGASSSSSSSAPLPG